MKTRAMLSLTIALCLAAGCSRNQPLAQQPAAVASQVAAPAPPAAPAPEAVAEVATVAATVDPTGLPHGVFELGPGGVRAFVSKLPAPGENAEPQTLFTFNQRSTRPMDEAGVQETLSAIADLMHVMQDDYAVSQDRVHILGSSELAAGPTAKLLSSECLRVMKRPLQFVSADEETRLAFKGLLRGRDLASATAVDIGGSEIRASYLAGKSTVTTAKLKQAELCAMAQKTPAIVQPGDLYLSGGIAWVLASSLAPPDTGLSNGPLVVELDAKEIDAWIAAALSNPQTAYEYRKDRVRAGGVPFADKNRRKVEGSFTPAQIAEGAKTLDALSRCLDFHGRKRILFDRDNDHAWQRAFLKEAVVEGGPKGP